MAPWMKWSLMFPYLIGGQNFKHVPGDWREKVVGEAWSVIGMLTTHYVISDQHPNIQYVINNIKISSSVLYYFICSGKGIGWPTMTPWHHDPLNILFHEFITNCSVSVFWPWFLEHLDAAVVMMIAYSLSFKLSHGSTDCMTKAKRAPEQGGELIEIIYPFSFHYKNMTAISRDSRWLTRCSCL